MSNIKIFENKSIRAVYDEDEEDWYFSVVDVCFVLAESAAKDKNSYWRKLKQRLKEEGSEVVTNCHVLKLTATDGKLRETDCLDTKGILRLVQSIPSPKAEPFKVWLASVGHERLQEISNPELAITRGAEYYRKKGYSEDWIRQRFQSIRIRKELTDEWKKRGIEDELDFAILTNEMTKSWSGMSVKEYKKYKGLKQENLRDNMSDIEMILNMLAEVTSLEISKKRKPSSFKENVDIVIEGGKIAKNTRDNIENTLEENIISKKSLEKIDN